jgi:hypothetical protein
MFAMIATVFPPFLQVAGGGVVAIICMIAERYFFSKSRWTLLLAMAVGFTVGQVIVGHILISMGAYHPIIVPDRAP